MSVAARNTRWDSRADPRRMGCHPAAPAGPESHADRQCHACPGSTIPGWTTRSPANPASWTTPGGSCPIESAAANRNPPPWPFCPRKCVCHPQAAGTWAERWHQPRTRPSPARWGAFRLCWSWIVHWRAQPGKWRWPAPAGRVKAACDGRSVCVSSCSVFDSVFRLRGSG